MTGEVIGGLSLLSTKEGIKCYCEMGKIMIVIEWAKQLQDSIVTFKPRENICR